MWGKPKGNADRAMSQLTSSPWGGLSAFVASLTISLDLIATFFSRQKASLTLTSQFLESCFAAAAIIFWWIEKLYLELLAHRSEEGINPSSIDLIWAHISAIYSSDLASDLYFPVDQGSNPGEVIFPKLQIWKILSGLSWESITVARSWILASSEL